MDHYRISREPLARGAQGAVYPAVGPRGERLAVKIAAPGKGPGDVLLREIAVLEALRDVPGVVRLVDTCAIDGRTAMVMPRLHGTLADWLRSLAASGAPEGLPLLLERIARLARTLAAVHRVDLEGGRLVHRDVKPENVLLDDDGVVFLGDFGTALTIAGLEEIELALAGTPMWAPLDQVLPGRTIPDPTWDTYALCVMLYAGLTGARPAYQADPRELLTPVGRQLWELATRAIAASGADGRTLRLAFVSERQGRSAADLVDATGRGALNEADRKVLRAGIACLAEAAGASERATALLQRGLWGLLVRGLSPISHPSPPNRFRDGDELADLLDDLRHVLEEQAPSRLLEDSILAGPMAVPDLPIDAPPARVEQGGPWGTVLALGLLAAGGMGALVAWPDLLWPGPTVSFEGGEVLVEGEAVQVAPFRLDRHEVSGARWAACSEAGACPPVEGAPDRPATPLALEEAEAWCAFAEGRLPTEAEWLLAAGERVWPWGEEPPDCLRARGAGCEEGLAPVGTLPEGATPEGVHDLAGNAWEWVRAADGSAVLRGGGASSGPSELGRRGRRIPTEPRPELAGVRCAYAP